MISKSSSKNVTSTLTYYSLPYPKPRSSLHSHKHTSSPPLLTTHRYIESSLTDYFTFTLSNASADSTPENLLALHERNSLPAIQARDQSEIQLLTSGVKVMRGWMRWSGMGWDGMAWHGMGWDGMMAGR
jgi:hypothetical protein